MPITVAKIQKELGNLKNDYIVLILVDAANYVKVNLGLLKYFLKKKRTPGIYITVNRLYENIIKALERKVLA